MSSLRASFQERLRSSQRLYQLASRGGYTAFSRNLGQASRMGGFSVTFGLRHTRISRGREVILIRPGMNALMCYRHWVWEDLARKLSFVERPDGGRVADCRHGTEAQLPSGGRFWVPDLPEPIDLVQGYFLKRGPQEGETVVDVGACYGEITLEMAARVGPRGRVFALEPDRENREILQRNVDASGLKNIRVLPVGLWEETRELEFFCDGNLGSTFAVSTFAGRKGRIQTIPSISPDELVRQIGRMPDFIKMDIEGAEIEVVRALLPLIGAHRPRLSIASYHSRAGTQTSHVLEPMLKQAGYQVESGFNSHRTTWAW